MSQVISPTARNTPFWNYAAVFALALAAYALFPYPDFFRGEDYEMGYQAASFYWSWVPDGENLSIVENLLYQIGMFAHSMLFYRHGAVPALYVGGFYGLFDAFGVPFSAAVFGLPTAILGATTAALFFGVLRQGGLREWVCWFGASALIFSPLFATLSRGFSMYMWVGPVFSFVLTIYAIQRLSGSKSSQYLLAFAIANLMLSDALFFLTLLALVAAYGLRNTDLGLSFREPGAFLRGFFQDLTPLLSTRILAPTALVFIALAGGALFTIKSSDALAASIPLNSILLATGKHSDFGFPGLILDSHWFEYPAVLLGHLGLFYVVLSAGFLAFVPSSFRDRFLWVLTILTGLGFGLIIYVVKPPSLDVIHSYQVYTLVPFVLVITLAANALASMDKTREQLAKALSAVFLLSAVASYGAYIFKLPTSFGSVYDLEAFGNHKTEYGNKAAGYVTRKLVSAHLQNNPSVPLEIIVYRDPDRAYPQNAYGAMMIYTSPYLTNAGLQQNGEAYRHRFGLTPSLKTKVIPDAEAHTHALPKCPADYCVHISSATPGTATTFTVVNDAANLVSISSNIEAADGLVSGETDVDELNRRFDAEYTDIEDFYPPRSADVKKKIVNVLRSKLGL